MSESVLSARGLSALTGAQRLLDEIDLDVAAGAVVAVLGESGAGKTTLGLALQGEHRTGIRLAGSVRLGTGELLGLPARQRRAARANGIGYLPQHPGAVLNPVRRIGGVLEELAAVVHATRHDREEAVGEALRAARLEPLPQLLRSFPHQLSGGQQQRVALAQALVARPGILVLDEPATGLDAITKSELAGTLERLSGAGTSLVVLTHDLALARRIADEVVVLRDGRSVEHGPANTVLSDPGHDWTRRLLAAEPRLESSAAPVAAQEKPGTAARSGLRARGLGKRAANGRRLLSDVDIDVVPGHCLALVGRSGAGKTTLARCLAGLSKPDTGEVVLDGTVLAPAVQRRTKIQRRRVQYVHQDARASFDQFSPVLAQVARAVRLARGGGKQEARTEAARLLSGAGVTPEQTGRRPGALSGGQLQRAAVARALAADPAVLVCDEITSGQDPVHQAGLLELLADAVRSTGVALVLISHDLPAVASVADEIYVLEAGRCVETAPTHTLLSAPGTSFARDLVASAREGAQPQRLPGGSAP
ncbi:ABC transporter ATP-binding protein [Saccharopolyspora erythraea]|uniref:ABC transporter ATP-binding protein n=1 Tax=Saccharopolyspora erythraea TaxID=1836 RepID=UPI001BA71B4D|nr:ATP-binding cassette domain-containing protein [Saccharopolyspora erythraea]QUH03366.1 ABC transporter ATP-binding protein [Saccharopolyspora erythraea]